MLYCAMDKIIRTALSSFGMSGAVFHAPFLLAHPGFDIVKVLERSKNLSSEQLPKSTIVRSYDAILKDKTIDLVVINTPNYMHFDMARMALQHGKHVLIEKPITPTAKEAIQLTQLGQKNGLVVATYHNRRFDSGYKTLQAIIKNQELGAISSFESRFDRYRPTIGPKKWKEAPHPGAGILYDLGAHLIDEALSLFGTPDKIKATLEIQRKEGTVIDFFKLILIYPNMQATLSAGMLEKDPTPRYFIKGDKANFKKFGNDVQEAQLIEKASPLKDNWGEEHPKDWGLLFNDKAERKVRSQAGNYMDYFNNLFNAIVLKEPLVITTTDAINVIKVIESAIESNKLKTTISVTF